MSCYLIVDTYDTAYISTASKSMDLNSNDYFLAVGYSIISKFHNNKIIKLHFKCIYRFIFTQKKLMRLYIILCQVV